jgi:hypothetical protein
MMSGIQGTTKQIDRHEVQIKFHSLKSGLKDGFCGISILPAESLSERPAKPSSTTELEIIVNHSNLELPPHLRIPTTHDSK